MRLQELHQLFLKHPTVSTDTRKIIKNSIFFALKGENFNGNKYASEALKNGAIYAIVDEEKYNTSNYTILTNNVLTTLQELANYHRNQSKAKIISLTGSNGKTTTKELINAVLTKKYNTIATVGNLNNHIGVPLTLLSIKEDTEIAIVEMGANHQKEIAFLSKIAEPDYGYITNFGKAHLEGFGGKEGVIKGKSELYDYLISNSKHIFLNADDFIQKKKLATYIKKFGYSENNHNYYKINFLEANPFVSIKVEEKIIQSKLIGSYNFSNCCAAILIGKYFNVSIDAIRTAIESYTPSNNRSQLIQKNGHHIILDAYNANPTSMAAALDNFKNTSGKYKVVFLGDMFELGNSAEEEHQFIAELVTGMNYDSVFLIGENFSRTNTSFKKFSSFNLLKNYLEKNSIKENSTLLIKGSRGMALERILDVL